MTKRTITLPSGNEMAYWTHGSGNKPTLLLVHGFTGSHDGFQYLVPLLDELNLIVPDLPGFGVSPLPHVSLTLAHLGELLTEFAEMLNLKQPPHLLGHSMGSLVVAEAVRQRPDLFAKKVILISPVPTPVGWLDTRTIGAKLGQFYYAASHRTPIIGSKLATSKNISRLSTHMIMTAKGKELRKKIHEHHLDNLNYISNIGWYRRLHAQINRTGLSRYRRALKPFDILIINGDKDSVTPLGHQKKASQILGAKLIVVPDVGHLSHYEKPLSLARHIKRFLV